MPVVILGVVVLYFLAGRLGLHFAFVHESASPSGRLPGSRGLPLLLLGVRASGPPSSSMAVTQRATVGGMTCQCGAVLVTRPSVRLNSQAAVPH